MKSIDRLGMEGIYKHNPKLRKKNTDKHTNGKKKREEKESEKER